MAGRSYDVFNSNLLLANELRRSTGIHVKLHILSGGKIMSVGFFVVIASAKIQRTNDCTNLNRCVHFLCHRLCRRNIYSTELNCPHAFCPRCLSVAAWLWPKLNFKWKRRNQLNLIFFIRVSWAEWPTHSMGISRVKSETQFTFFTFRRAHGATPTNKQKWIEMKYIFIYYVRQYICINSKFTCFLHPVSCAWPHNNRNHSQNGLA